MANTGSDNHSILEMNLPNYKKKKGGPVLGVIEPGLATAITDGLDISCRSDDTIRELCRGVRQHLNSFISGLDNGASTQAQLGLAHSYSRAKVKFNPARSDNMIIQSIALLDSLDKDLNTFAMRIREWYSWHFPELKELVKDNYMFARCAALIQNKSSLFAKEDEDAEIDAIPVLGGTLTAAEKMEKLKEITGDDDVANAVLSAAKTSMGVECTAVDMLNIVNFTQRMIKLAEYRKNLSAYLSDKMEIVAPNLSTLIGDTVAARLISKAGSLTNLAKAPASTVQILGAEKALFRALKTKGNTPKYGLIYHSTFIGRADAKNKGRISRYLANKCSIATRIDSFSEDPSKIYGEKLRDQVEERLKFYETGAAPRKNIDVMNEVAKELKKDSMESDSPEKDDVEMTNNEDAKKKSKKEKKAKKRKSQDIEVVVKMPDKKEKKEKKKKKKVSKSE